MVLLKTNDRGLKKYVCVRSYLVIYLNENNMPLNKDPIQLTAKETFKI